MICDNPKTEIIRNLPFEDYCQIPGLNQSLLKTHDQDYDGCPALFRYRATHPDTRDSLALRDGRAFHAKLLEPDTFENLYRVMLPGDCEAIFQNWLKDGADSKSKAAYMAHKSYQSAMEAGCRGFTTSKAYKAWVGSDSREVLSAERFAALSAMSVAIWENPPVAEAIEGVSLDDCEVTIMAGKEMKDGTKFQLKARLDLITTTAIIDAKTCRSANGRRFAYDAHRYGYDIQAAHYLECAKIAGLERARFGFLAQEKEPPFLNCIHWIPDDWLKHARARYKRILTDIAESFRLDQWPNPISGELEPPEFLKKELENF